MSMVTPLTKYGIHFAECYFILLKQLEKTIEINKQTKPNT